MNTNTKTTINTDHNHNHPTNITITTNPQTITELRATTNSTITEIAPTAETVTNSTIPAQILTITTEIITETGLIQTNTETAVIHTTDIHNKITLEQILNIGVKRQTDNAISLLTVMKTLIATDLSHKTNALIQITVITHITLTTTNDSKAIHPLEKITLKTDTEAVQQTIQTDQDP